MPTVLIPPAGQPTPRVEKRAEETVQYTLDVSKLLDERELVTGIESITPNVERCRPRKGRTIEIYIPPDTSVGAANFTEHKVTVLFKTTTDSIKSAVFSVKAYK